VAVAGSSMKRRTLLKASLQLGFAATIIPGPALSAYPTKAFLAKQVPDAMQAAFGTADIGESDQIVIEAPHIASDASMVPVRISSGFENTESITLVVTGNKSPFTAFFKLHETPAFVSTRIRMSDSSDLLVVVKADGVLHAHQIPVRVGRNGCGD
jgi:sulfur-oxidizing protein SoxY